MIGSGIIHVLWQKVIVIVVETPTLLCGFDKTLEVVNRIQLMPRLPEFDPS